MNKYQNLVDEIVKLSGGENNITKVWSCFSRLRFNAKDKSLVNLEEIEKLEGVLGCQFSTGHFQIVIGNDAVVVAETMQKTLSIQEDETVEPKKQKMKINEVFFDTLAGIFTPIIVAIVSAGLLKGILATLVLLNGIQATSDTYQILSVVADAPFYFLPFLLAVSTARKFNTNEYLAISVAGALMYPTILNASANGIEHFKFLGLNIPALNYSSTVLPVILSVILLSYVFRYMNKILPNMLRFILTPTLTLLIVMPIVYIFIAPLGMNVGSLLTQVSLWIMGLSPVLYGLFIGSLYPLIIATGMHYAFFPVLLDNVASNGFENIFLPIAVVGNMAIFAAMLAVFISSKDKKLKQISLSSSISAFFGVTEPALFGVVLTYKKVLYAVSASIGVVSAFLMFLDVKMFAFVAPSALALPVFVNPDGTNGNLIGILACIAVAMLVTFVLTYFAFKKEEKAN